MSGGSMQLHENGSGSARFDHGERPISADGEVLVRLRGVSRNFGKVEAVKPLDLDIQRGDFVAILGPSGCGKTTLLRMIGGFVHPSTGTVEIDGRDVTNLNPEHRPTNMVFQGYGLFPHMTVRQNVAYGLKIAGRPRKEIDQRVDEALDLIQLGELAGRTIDKLSGGQQQRIALARALILRPDVLLLDEPLAALDLKLRQAMQEELRRIHKQIGGTFVFVTHDQGEALALANRIAVMDGGALVQVGDAEEIYFKPRTRFVSEFIGEANVFDARRASGRVILQDGDASQSFADTGNDGPVTLMIRPESMHLIATADEAEMSLPATVTDVLFLGAVVRFVLKTGGGRHVIVHETDLAWRERVKPGDSVVMGWSLGNQRVIDE